MNLLIWTKMHKTNFSPLKILSLKLLGKLRFIRQSNSLCFYTFIILIKLGNCLSLMIIILPCHPCPPGRRLSRPLLLRLRLLALLSSSSSATQKTLPLVVPDAHGDLN